MTNKEAIEKLKEILFMTGNKEALDLAIKALEERPQGEWIDTGLEYKCNKCGVRYDIDITEITDFKFCPNCGAEMASNSAK